MAMRGIRGATTVTEDKAEEIWSATTEMVDEILRRNRLSPVDIGALIFTATADLQSAFPATGARKLPGMNLVPVFDAQQLAVDGSLTKCIRVLALVETELSSAEISHVYLRNAASLRPDLTSN